MSEKTDPQYNLHISCSAGKMSFTVIFSRGRGLGRGGGVGWGGRWRGREKGRVILLYNHFLK